MRRTKETKRLVGEFSISRIHGAEDSEAIRIEVEDTEARIHAFTVYLSLQNFAEALTGLHAIDCVFEASPLIGTIGEHKEELVPVPNLDKRLTGKNWQAKALKPFEVDGWRARSGDIDNHHRHSIKNSKDYQRVVFFRHVAKEDK